MNKWPVAVKYYDDKAVYPLDFWFSRKDTPLYSQSVAFGLRRIEVLMPVASHIRLIRTDGLVLYSYLKQLYQHGIKQLGYQHRETVYRGQSITVNLKKLNGKKIMFHVAARVGQINVVVLSKSGDITHKITGEDLRRDCIVEKDIYELYFGAADKVQLIFEFDQETELTMLNIEPMDIVQGDQCVVTMQELATHKAAPPPNTQRIIGLFGQDITHMPTIQLASQPASQSTMQPASQSTDYSYKRKLCWPAKYPDLDTQPTTDAVPPVAELLQ
jgi:hypothetical protein